MPDAFSLRASFEQARTTLDAFLADDAAQHACQAALATLTNALRAGNKLLICGNGGSMCDAAHFAEELTGRFRKDRPPLAAIACTEPGHLTCVANDYGFEHVFARFVRALGKPADVLILLSTSGNSSNCLLAADAARAAKITVVALLGKSGGELRPKADCAVIAPGPTADRIQEIHKLILHTWVEGIEHGLGF
jgi:D-sedoheptulose 7-phosphate isomerase